jgi:redox-sensitive bicupin YhaK (pirin superfamily)
MMQLRRSDERGYADHGWLKSFHTFSFAGYHDPRFMGWGNLRVINEDRIAPGTGFGTHGHQNMEIISYVLSGELAHRDSMGHVQSIPPGEVQRMSAGSGVTHSEFNHAQGQTTHFLQIWILPDVAGVEPSYEQKRFDDAQKRGQLCRVVDGQGRDGALRMHADASVWAGCFDGEESAVLTDLSSRHVWVQVVRGSLQANGHNLGTGDALMMKDEAQLLLANGQDAEVLVFDLKPMLN